MVVEYMQEVRERERIINDEVEISGFANCVDGKPFIKIQPLKELALRWVADKLISFGWVKPEYDVPVGHLSGNFQKSVGDISLIL